MAAAGGLIEVRADGLDGGMLGQSTVAAPAEGGRGGGGGGNEPTTIALQPTSGVHDLYFVFRNVSALGGQPLMTLTAIQVN